MNDQFDVFLCHNSQDKPEVIEIAQQLQQRGLKPWLDVWELRPGLTWQELLEEQIGQIKVATVFVGSSGFGPWQEREMRAFLNEFVNRSCLVIPVLLKSAPQKPDLPIFLRAMTWVDFKSPYSDPMKQLIWGITGVKPELKQKHNLTPTNLDLIPTPPAFYAEPPYIGTHEFIGRKAELDMLNSWANSDDPHPILLLEAIGGQGYFILNGKVRMVI